MIVNNNFCVIVFSHADIKEKEEILFESLTSIKKLNLPIILASHISVSERNQNLCNYYIKDDNNLILSESDILSNPVELTDNLYNITDYFGGFKFETSVFKKNYQAGVFNLYISSFNLAKNLGFKYVVLWEYDYILGNKSMQFIIDTMDLIKCEELDFVSFESTINIFNNDVIQKSIRCAHAIPLFYNLEKFIYIIPNVFLKNGLDYNKLTNLMIIEQWIKYYVIDKSLKKRLYSFDIFHDLLPDTKIGQIHTQRDNYLLSGIRSGVYLNECKTESCVLFANMSSTPLRLKITLFGDNKNILYDVTKDLYPMFWVYDVLDHEILNLFNTDEGCDIIEEIQNKNNGDIDIIEYNINRNNLDFISKLKRFS